MRAGHYELISSQDVPMTRISMKRTMTTINSYFLIKDTGQSIPVSTAIALEKTLPTIIYKIHQTTSTRHYSSNFRAVESNVRHHVKMASQLKRYKRSTKSLRKRVMHGRVEKYTTNDILYFLLIKISLAFKYYITPLVDISITIFSMSGRHFLSMYPSQVEGNFIGGQRQQQAGMNLGNLN